MNRAYILETNSPIEPFGDPASDIPFGTETMAQAQERAFSAAGVITERIKSLQEIKEKRAILTFDDVYLSERAAVEFSKAHEESGLLALALADGPMTRFGRPLQGLRMVNDDLGRLVAQYDIFTIDQEDLNPNHDAAQCRKQLREAARPFFLDARVRTRRIRLPEVGYGRPYLDYPASATAVMHLRHWVHILWLNQLAPGILWAEYMRRHRLKTLWTLLRSFSRNPDKLMRKFKCIGKNCRIHPTASIEMSMIGDNVEIGPHVHIRGSIISDRCAIHDHSMISNSVLGAHCLVLRDTCMASCCSYPDATLANYKVQSSLFGRNVFLTSSVGLIDARFGGPVKVEYQGEFHSVDTPFLGSCLGHGVVLGAYVSIESGRAVPNNYMIVPPKERVITTIPKDLPEKTPLMVQDGKLVKR